MRHKYIGGPLGLSKNPCSLRLHKIPAYLTTKRLSFLSLGSVKNYITLREEGGSESVIMKEFSYFSYRRKFRNVVRWGGVSEGPKLSDIVFVQPLI